MSLLRYDRCNSCLAYSYMIQKGRGKGEERGKEEGRERRGRGEGREEGEG